MTKNNEWIIYFMGSLDRLLDSFEHLTTNCRPTLQLPPKPCTTFASVHRERVTDGMKLNNTIGCYPCHMKRTA